MSTKRMVPVFDHAGEVMAVLDIDSAQTGAFDETDKRELESGVKWFAQDAAAPGRTLL